MVRINFSEPNQENPFGVVKAEVFSNSISVDLPWKKPLKFRVTGKIDKKVKWDNELWEGTWSCFFEPYNTISEVLDQEGNVITKWEWDTFSHGDEAHSLFMLWCLNNKGAKGGAIVTGKQIGRASCRERV